MKAETIFVCQSCQKQLLKWMGRCPGCGEWNTITERDAPAEKNQLFRIGDCSAPAPLSEIPCRGESRITVGMQEFDRVLGGGIVRSSLVLVGGDPGIGKSTLLMQVLASLAKKKQTVLYVSGEESVEQLKLRADRLNISGSTFLIAVENELESILQKIAATPASVIVIDSVQSIYSKSFESQAGSVGQIRQVAGKILEITKNGPAASILVGHVTKDGGLAGPKVLEHMVDSVLYFEGERGHSYRILRGTKNRFGSISEIGVFEMTDCGLTEVTNPSELFLAERAEGASGSVVTALVEGTRPILAEVQALVTGPIPGQGRRTCLGTDSQRVALIIAVIEKKLGYSLGNYDIFTNVVGGIKAIEPAADLAIMTAILSSYADRPVAARTLVFGEVGLSGEIRRVSRAESRINEGARLGFDRIIAPVNIEKSVQANIVNVRNVNELVSVFEVS